MSLPRVRLPSVQAHGRVRFPRKPKRVRMPALVRPVQGFVLAVDAAAHSGWALYDRGHLLESGACALHSDEVTRVAEFALGGPHRTRLRAAACVMVIEKPFRSGHVSAYVGVGAAIGVWRREWVRSGGGARRIVRVYPLTWRAATLGNIRGATREQWKAMAVARVRTMYPGITNEDQAEAVLIGFWAALSPLVLAKMPAAIQGAR